MKEAIAILLCGLLLSGCASTAAISDISDDKVEVTVQSHGGQDKALQMSRPEAARGCSRYDKQPELLSSRAVGTGPDYSTQWIFLYACVGADIVREID